MIKKFIACLLIAMCIFNTGTFAHANNIDVTKYEVSNPEKTSYSTEDKIVLINGKAPSSTEITIDVYGTTDNTTDINKRKNFHLNNLPTEEEYILISNETVTSGNMGLFSKELDLAKGINKIVVDFNTEGVDSVEIIVYVYNRVRTNIREPRLGNLLQPLLK
ncbi:MAG: hypothetical protein PHY91_04315 [Tissierellia bacterium]|nr:hypothetical protein [Tissierellia bacterium]MDD4726577.1 hypothetical protein [Tissierellia bacterium]